MSRRFVLPVTAALFLFVGCGGDGGGDGGPTEPQGKGTLSGEVAGPGGGIPGARVAIQGGPSVETNSEGEYSISDLEAGAKTVTVTPPAGFTLATGETASKSATVTANGTVTMNWSVRLTDTAPTAVEVGLSSNRFISDDVTVPVGSTVTWYNQTAITHTISPNNPSQAGTWEDQTISGEGTEFQHTFGTAGTYDYVCKLHSGMTGVIRVH